MRGPPKLCRTLPLSTITALALAHLGLRLVVVLVTARVMPLSVPLQAG